MLEDDSRMARGWPEDGPRMATTSLYFLSYNATPCYYTTLYHYTIPLYYTTILQIYYLTFSSKRDFLLIHTIMRNRLYYEISVFILSYYSLLPLYHYTIQLYSTTILQIYYLTFSSKRDFLLIMRNRSYYEISVFILYSTTTIQLYSTTILYYLLFLFPCDPNVCLTPYRFSINYEKSVIL